MARLEIEEAFSKIGPIRNIWVAKDPPSFAYVEMEDPRDAEDAMKALHNTEICGMRARVEMAKEGIPVQSHFLASPPPPLPPPSLF